MQLFVSWSLSVYTLNQVARFMQFVYKLNPPKWRILTMKTLSYKLRRLSICSFDQITSLLFPLSSHVLFTMCFICWWCCNLLTSNQDLWLVRDKNVSRSLLYRILEHVLSQSVYHATSKSCMTQSSSNNTFTLYFLVYDTSIMILALPCNRGLSDLRQVGGFLLVLRFSPPIKLTATK
jgi:hypothetical protein